MSGLLKSEMAARPVLQIDPQRRSRCPLFAIFLPPRISERYNLAGRIACDAASFVKIAHVASPDGTGPNNYCRPLFSRSLSAGFDPFFSFAGGLSRAGGGFTCFPASMSAFPSSRPRQTFAADCVKTKGRPLYAN